VPKNKDGDAGSVIIIKRVKKGGHGHHGGGWKVALADFMTAMMAFFLLLWLVESATKKELVAIAAYFLAPGDNFVVGPGGSDASLVDLKAPMEESPVTEAGISTPLDSGGIMGDGGKPSEEKTEAEEEETAGQEGEAETKAAIEAIIAQEKAQLEQLEDQLQDEIENLDSALYELKDQIHMEVTDLGLVIDIVDKDRHTMFNPGSAILVDYAKDALHELAPIINKVPNKISISGHTDSTPYGPGALYTNWELSADRANSARRALLMGSYPEAKVVAVQGMASVSPLLPEKPTDPANRRIAITVLKKAVSDAMTNTTAVPLPSVVPDAEPITAAPVKVLSEQEVDEAIERDMANKKSK
jgi:chemotaxis protein MotB